MGPQLCIISKLRKGKTIETLGIKQYYLFMDILIGTRNEYKKNEMIWFLGNNSNIKIHFLDELDINLKVAEDHKSLIRNAEKKAKELSLLTDYYVLTSDGGVDIPGLGKKWNILKNQRTVGENNTDLVKAKILLDLMKDVRKEERKVTYNLALALAKKGKVIWSKEEVTDRGYIAENLFSKKIPKYLWMGQIWYYPKHKKVFNQLNKNELDDVRKVGIELRKSLMRQLRKII